MKNKKDEIENSERDFSKSHVYSPELEKSIQAGLEDLAKNRVKPHSRVMAEFKKNHNL